ncbi:MAG: putative signal peptide peptidase SppA [Dehalococcoidia bacterium]|nr:putative signal peptide peptidase SppA [Chloroflexota bacterium]
MRNYGAHLLQSFADSPALFSPSHVNALRALAETKTNHTLSSLIAQLASGLGISKSRAQTEYAELARVDAACAVFGVTISDRSKPFAFSEGLAIIPVWGTLLHRDAYCDESATGYDYIRARFDAAMADDDVKGIVFDIHSPGGHVAGNFELAEDIFKGREKKPSLAVVDSMCYSGGYSLGSAATRLVASPSGGAGSIGVVMMHVNVEGMLKNFGVEINLIHAGARKVDGNMFRSLPEDVRARYQASVEKSYDKFISLVARNRGLTPDAVRATEAECYDADESLTLGLIDAVMSPKEAVTAFRNELSGSNVNTQQGEQKMVNETPALGSGDAAVTVSTATAERARIASILNCEEAVGRETLARHFALETDMDANAAKKALGLSPKSAAPVMASPDSAFVAAMNAGDNPNVGADGGDLSGELTIAQRVAGHFHGATSGMHHRNK